MLLHKSAHFSMHLNAECGAGFADVVENLIAQ